MRPLVTTIAFAGKEIRQVLRQPKLMAALILGPFVILGLFAAGFQATAPALETIVVVPESSGIEVDPAAVNEELGGRLTIVEVTSDEASASDRLSEGEADLVVVIPPDPEATVRAGEEATVTVLHDRLDPFDRAAINVTAEAAVSDFNRTLLASVAATAQERAGRLEEVIPEARRSASVLADALERGDGGAATSARAATSEALDEIERELDGVSGFAHVFDGGADVGEGVATARSSLDATESDLSVEQAHDLEASLAELESTVAAFRSVPPEVLVQPFRADTHTISGVDVPVTIYYSPAVIVVLLQHVVLTFAALSLVNERTLGTTEVFRVSPISTTELMVGKLLGYSVLGALVGALLAVVTVFVLGTTMVGSWVWLVTVLALTMAASLGLGFLIAAAAASDAQAVQYAMLALLFTIFFGGLVVSLDRLSEAVRQLAFLAPATAGTAALHDVMFRGRPPEVWLLMILGGYALATFLLARWWIGRQKIA